MPFVALRIDVEESCAELVAEFLFEAGATGVITGVWELDDAQPPEAGRTVVEVHVPGDDAGAMRDALEAWLPTAAARNEALRDARISAVTLPDVDWLGVFRAHHTPVTIGRRLLVAPPWDVPDAPGREILVIEPGMAFGTGQHATTRTCLEEIEDTVAAGGIGSALDVGTGSGVLAAALVRLGVRRVVATDLDPAVLPLARETLARNRAGGVHLLCGRADAVAGSFDLVVANLLANAIVADASALASAVAPHGHLILSGLLAAQVPQALEAFPGWQVATTRADGEWRTVRVRRAA